MQWADREVLAIGGGENMGPDYELCWTITTATMWRWADCKVLATNGGEMIVNLYTTMMWRWADYELLSICGSETMGPDQELC